MCNLAYLYPEYTPFFICDTASLERYEPKPQPCDWTDGELTAIRFVLQKLTAIRVMNSSDAEDLVQDTLLTMVMKYHEGDLEKGLLVWSMGILRKKVGNYYRKAQRYTSLSDQEGYGCEWTRHSMAAASPEVKVHYKELQALVDNIVASFPPRQRQVMELLLAGFQANEIVGQLHPERYQNVINRLHRGRKKLARELAKYGYGPSPKAGAKTRGEK